MRAHSRAHTSLRYCHQFIKHTWLRYTCITIGTLSTDLTDTQRHKHITIHFSFLYSFFMCTTRNWIRTNWADGACVLYSMSKNTCLHYFEFEFPTHLKGKTAYVRSADNVSCFIADMYLAYGRLAVVSFIWDIASIRRLSQSFETKKKRFSSKKKTNHSKPDIFCANHHRYKE